MISFIIPAYNEEALIAECIQSIANEAGNTVYEIIVVDNGSIDSTAEIAKGFGATVISEPIRGTNVARQAGFLASRGDLIALIDADSKMPAGWIAAALGGLRDRGVVAVSGPPVYPDIPPWLSLVVTIYFVLSGFLNNFWPMTMGGNCMIRRSALEAIGGFDPAFDFYGDDADTALRLDKVGRTKLVPTMWIWQSARRMHNHGWLRTGRIYITNYIWVHLTGRPWSRQHDDVRK